jgi:Cdc6-like AAA superfamily ATPase
MLSRSLDYDRGLNLLNAPDMGDHLFIGRDDELEQMKTILLSNPDSSGRKVLVLSGMGGIGKTQIAIRYAKRHHTSYSSVFWVNATSESTLTTSLRRLAPQILPGETIDQLDNDQLWVQISLWLSKLENSRWLLIFDNYDDPDQYQIEQYYPFVAHGSVIITTRQLDRVNGYQTKVQSMTNEEDSLNILAKRSGRLDVSSGNDNFPTTM